MPLVMKLVIKCQQLKMPQDLKLINITRERKGKLTLVLNNKPMTKNNNKDHVLTLGQLPFMPNSQPNIQKIEDWWRNKSIPDVEDKGGSFNRELYYQFLKIVNNP